MRKILFLFAVTALLAACGDDSSETPVDPVSAAFASATYFEATGTNTVPNVEGENQDQPFVMDGVRVEAVIVSETALDIYFYGINFSSKMPVTIDMVIPGVSYTRTPEKITLTGNDIIPTMGGNPFARYIITDLRGTITPEAFNLTNNYGSYIGCRYAGQISKMEKQ